MKHTYLIFAVFLLACSTPEVKETEASDPLPSWNEGENKKEIISFVHSAVDSNSVGFIPVEERIVVMDNDGTLWSEQPLYFQLVFAMDLTHILVSDHPEWDTLMPFSAVLSGDTSGFLAGGEHAILDLVMGTHAGITDDEFSRLAMQWADTAVNSEKGMRYVDLVYQPMLELMDFLKSNNFSLYIVSGGGIDFMRSTLSEVYGVDSENILGTTIKKRVTEAGDTVRIERMPDIGFINDKEGKVENIERVIGKKPVICMGNSDGDLAMMKYTATSENFLNIYVHHTDKDREWAYDRKSHIGRFDRGLDHATQNGWCLVDMAADWNTVYSTK